MSIKNIRLEVMQFLENKVDDFVDQFLIPVETIWQPSDFLPDAQSENFFEEVKELQEIAKDLPYDFWVAMVGDTITEEALPTYESWLMEVEGVMGEELVEFYGDILKLPNIEIRGIGTNLNCLSGIMPTQDKLIQLSLYKQLIEAKFNITIPWVSGGTSVAIPLILKNARPMAVNHFRIGEALFFGKDLFTGETIEGMHNDVFKLYSEIIEITEKPDTPVGELGESGVGTSYVPSDTDDLGETSLRAILDIGLLDMQPQYIEAEDNDITIIDASSDMLVIDISSSKKKYKVGDLVSFKIQYMGALYLLNSDYIEKTIG